MFIEEKPCKLSATSFQSPVLSLLMNQGKGARESNRTLLIEIHLPDLKAGPSALKQFCILG